MKCMCLIFNDIANNVGEKLSLNDKLTSSLGAETLSSMKTTVASSQFTNLSETLKKLRTKTDMTETDSLMNLNICKQILSRRSIASNISLKSLVKRQVG